MEKKKRISIGKVNGSDIFAVTSESGEILVPIRPICEAIGVDHSAQTKRIKRHYVYSSTVVTVTTVASDGKPREMLCIPLKYSYGWLMSIDADQVSPDIRQTVIRYQVECHEALYSHFFLRSEKQKEANQAEMQELENLRQLLSQEKQIKSQISETKSRIDKIRSARLDDQPTLF